MRSLAPLSPLIALIAAATSLAAAVLTARAQDRVPTQDGTPTTQPMCLDRARIAVPCPLQDLVPVPGVTAPNIGPTADQKAQVVTISPNSFAVRNVSTAAVASSVVLKNAPGKLTALTVTIGATAGWLMLFDAIALPSDGATTTSTLKFCYPINSDGTKGGLALAWPQPLPFLTGITAAFSSTACNSLTASATAFFYGQVM